VFGIVALDGKAKTYYWNNREAQDMFVLVIVALVIGAALPYAELIGKIAATSSSVSDEPLEFGDEPS